MASEEGLLCRVQVVAATTAPEAEGARWTALWGGRHQVRPGRQGLRAGRSVWRGPLFWVSL